LPAKPTQDRIVLDFFRTEWALFHAIDLSIKRVKNSGTGASKIIRLPLCG
jgi:hypothetical protein